MYYFAIIYHSLLQVTDQPRDRPKDGPLSASEKEKHIILALTPPPDAVPALTLVMQLADALPKLTLRPETKTKLKRTRDEVDKELKEELVKDKREEDAEEKKAAKRRAEQERVARLSAAEQKRVLEREKKRNLRKAQGKMATRNK